MTTISQKVELVLGAKDSGAAKGLKNIELGAKAAEKATAVLQNAINAAGAYFATKFTVGFVTSIVKTGTALSGLSRGIGVSVEDLSRLKFAFETAGVGGDKLQQVLETLEKKRAAALRGSKESSDAFGVLGIDFEQLSSLNAAELLDEIAGGLGRFATAQQKASALAPIFESNLGALADVLGQGKESFQNLTREADTFGATISTQTANDLERAESKFRTFTTVVDSLASSLGAKALSTLFGSADGSASPVGSTDRSVENIIEQMRQLQERAVNVQNAFALVGVAGLTFDEVMHTQTLSAERLSEVLQALAKRLNDVIQAQAKAKADAASVAAGPQGPAFGPEARALNRDAEGEAARNARFAAPSDNSRQARAVTDAGFVDGLTQSWDRLVETMGTANAVGQQFGSLVGGAISGVSDILVDMIATGESSSEMWKRLGASVASELAKIAIQYAIIGAIKGASGISFAHGGVGGGDGNDEPPMRIHKFAHGGMAGGIAGGASVAVYGETSRREAFVPLQDGRSIPVRIEGSGGSSVQTVYYINAIDTKSMAQALQQHGAIYRGAVRDGLAGQGGDRRIAKRAVR